MLHHWNHEYISLQNDWREKCRELQRSQTVNTVLIIVLTAMICVSVITAVLING